MGGLVPLIHCKLGGGGALVYTLSVVHKAKPFFSNSLVGQIIAHELDVNRTILHM